MGVRTKLKLVKDGGEAAQARAPGSPPTAPSQHCPKRGAEHSRGRKRVPRTRPCHRELAAPRVLKLPARAPCFVS